MSDSEEITRKVRGGKKIVDKPAVAKRATKTTEVEPAEKKRKLANGDIKSLFQAAGAKVSVKSSTSSAIKASTTAAVNTASDDVTTSTSNADEAATVANASGTTSKVDSDPSSNVVPIPSGVDIGSPKEQAIWELEKTMGTDWFQALKEEFTKGYFRTIRNFLIAEIRKGSTVYPATENIYSWSRLTPLNEVKVIIVGQDPYHGPNQAHGLSFSVLPPTRPPPSLVNIYKELESSVSGFKKPKSGDLTALAKEGVLWLNTSLTVRAANANSHSKIGWDQFTRAAMQAVLSRPGQKGVVFIAWGAHAQKAVAGFDAKKNLILKGVHPSPLSASKGFFGCDHFNRANKWLKEKYGAEGQIDWTVINQK